MILRALWLLSDLLWRVFCFVEEKSLEVKGEEK